MKTLIPKGTARWITIPYVSTEHYEEVADWIEANGLDVEEHGAVVHPNTFETMQKWFVLYEEDKTIFLLKWS